MKLAVGYSSGNMPVKDEIAVKLSQVVDNLKRWQEHLHSILNHPKPENAAPLFKDTQNMVIYTVLRGKANPRIKAIRGIKTTQPGVVDISPELLKAVESVMSTILLTSFHEIWMSKNMREDFKTSLIVKLVKKEDLCDCINWRGTTLLSLTSKEEQRGRFELRI